MKLFSRQKIRRADLLLIAGLLAVSIVAYAAVQFLVRRDGVYAVVKVDGQKVEQLSLKQAARITVEGYQGGTNEIVVEEGRVYMLEADCPDKICVRTGKISHTGQTIVCLPHRVVVEITGGEASIDSLVQ